MLVKVFLFLIAFTISYKPRLSGTIYGADQTTIQGQLAITGANNIIANTAYIENGFNLTNNTTTCSFDSFQSCLGVINLNRGKLYLLRDMFLDNFFSFGAGGQIYGQGHTISFPNTSAIQFPDSKATKTLGSGPISTQTMGSTVNSVSWSYDDKYVAAGANTSTGNLRIYEFSNNTLSAAISSTTIGSAVNSLAWSPTNNYLAVGIASSTNSITIYQWDGSTLSTVANDRKNLSSGVSALVWSPDGKYLAVAYGALTSAAIQIYSYSGSGTLTAIGSAYNYGSLSTYTIDRALSWNSIGGHHFLAIGYYTIVLIITTGYIALLNFNGSSLTEVSGSPHSLSTSTPASIAYRPGETNGVNTIAVGLSASATRFRLYNPYLGDLDQTWANTESTNYNSICWSNDGSYLATGLDTGDTNIRIYYFPGNNSSLSLTSAAYKLSLISELTVGSDVNTIDWSNVTNDYLVTGYGTTVGVFQVNQLSEYRKALSIDTTNIYLNSDMELINTTTFYGNCSIIGNGNNLTLNNSSGKIIIASEGSLSFKNLNLLGLKNQNILCLENNSKITFENCKITLTSDFNFSKGSILFNQDVIINGTNKFIYSSTMASTINSNSSLFFSNGLTFSYAPTEACNNLIFMPDNSSCLFLDGCTLHLTKTGLNLITGKIFFDNNVSIETESILSESNALTFGNGNPKNDLDINILAGSIINISGRLEYLNLT